MTASMYQTRRIQAVTPPRRLRDFTQPSVFGLGTGMDAGFTRISVALISGIVRWRLAAFSWREVAGIFVLSVLSGLTIGLLFSGGNWAAAWLNVLFTTVLVAAGVWYIDHRFKELTGRGDGVHNEE